MRVSLVIALVLVPLAAQAKSWRNVKPGETSKAEVLKRFGDPTTELAEGKKTVLAYEGDEAIEGTKQAQFIIGADGKVEQIAIFPATVVEKASVASTFGPSCAEKEQPNCYVQKVSDDDFKTYFWYEQLGLVVFFDAAGKNVASFLYVKPGAPKSSAAK
jgi:hypothetical protein